MKFLLNQVLMLFLSRLFITSYNLLSQIRTIFVPPQVKAYGDIFKPINSIQPSHKLISVDTLKANSEIEYIDSFENMLLYKSIRIALGNLHISLPSPPQQMSANVLLNRHSAIIASPSGSGKTIAFLAPLYHNLLYDKNIHQVSTREYRPRALIIAPTAELCRQLAYVCSFFDKEIGTKTLCIDSKRRNKHYYKNLLKNNLYDVIVSPPQPVLRKLQYKKLFLDDLRYVIYDEADSLVDPSQHRESIRLLKFIRKRRNSKYLWPVDTQIIFSTSLMTPILNKIASLFDCSKVIDDSLHVVPVKIKHKFYNVNSRIDRWDYLIYLINKYGHRPIDQDGSANDGLPMRFDWPLNSDNSLQDNTFDTNKKSNINILSDTNPLNSTPLNPSQSNSNSLNTDKPVVIKWGYLKTTAAPITNPHRITHILKSKRVVIFFNNIRSCDGVYHKLLRNGYGTVLVHGGLSLESKNESFMRWSTGQCNIICCTDALGRGLDMTVDVVINWSIPKQSKIYIYRSGRTGRMGRHGAVCNIYTKKERWITSALMKLTHKNISLENVNNYFANNEKPSHKIWMRDKKNALARRFVMLMTRKTIPAALEKTYLKHNATYRPLYKPEEIKKYAGVNPKLQKKKTDRAKEIAVWARKELLARRKGGSAKFGKGIGKRSIFGEVDGARPRLHSQDVNSPNHNEDHIGPPSPPTDYQNN